MVLYIGTDGGCTGNGKPTCVATWGYTIISENDFYQLEPIREKSYSLKGVALARTVLSQIECYDGCGLVPTGAALPPASNNRGELNAALEGMRFIKEDALDCEDIIWVSDSAYTLNSVDDFSRRWTADPVAHRIEEKKNLDLILPLRDLIDEFREYHKLTLVHVNSHIPPPPRTNELTTKWVEWFVNERADKLCDSRMKEYKAQRG